MLEIRGYSLLQGYLDDPVATAKSFDKDGWFETGDAGYIDKDGFVYVSDRSEWNGGSGSRIALTVSQGHYHPRWRECTSRRYGKHNQC